LRKSSPSKFEKYDSVFLNKFENLVKKSDPSERVLNPTDNFLDIE
jgi:hypothetical protein